MILNARKRHPLGAIIRETARGSLAGSELQPEPVIFFSQAQTTGFNLQD